MWEAWRRGRRRGSPPRAARSKILGSQVELDHHHVTLAPMLLMASKSVNSSGSANASPHSSSSSSKAPALPFACGSSSAGGFGVPFLRRLGFTFPTVPVPERLRNFKRRFSIDLCRCSRSCRRVKDAIADAAFAPNFFCCPRPRVLRGRPIGSA
eukprot:scaffold8272_cov248-Pinguiococcus_pyrenoidosus.AAC.10